MNRDHEQALIGALEAEGLVHIKPERSSRRHGSIWIAFLLGVIATWFVMGVVPYWRLLLQVWNGCVA